MKVKKLMELLSEYDSEQEVVISTEQGNVDIFYLELKEGYWDGSYQILERDWDNMNRLIDKKGGWWWLKRWRKRIARKYYMAVKYFGSSAFRVGKGGLPL